MGWGPSRVYLHESFSNRHLYQWVTFSGVRDVRQSFPTCPKIKFRRINNSSGVSILSSEGLRRD